MSERGSTDSGYATPLSAGTGRRFTPIFCGPPAFDIDDLSPTAQSEPRSPVQTATALVRRSSSKLLTLPEPLSSNALVQNFLLMATVFSTNHGTVTALIGLATTNLDPDTGNLQSALLYTCYTLTALFAATTIITWCGDRVAIIAGLWGYVAYTASFIVADQFPSITTSAACIGGCIGGVASGFLWTAQFSYFGKNAALYAQALQRERHGTDASPADVDLAVSQFASWFALLYLSLEVLFKLLQSFIGNSTGQLSAGWVQGKDMIYVINTCCAAVAAACCFLIADLDIQLGQPVQLQEPIGLLREVLSATKLFMKDPKMPLMCGMNCVFGFSMSYMNGYVTGIVVPFYIENGKSYSGYLLALSATVAGMVTLPSSFGYFADLRSKRYLMVFAPVSFAVVVGLPLCLGFGNVAGSSGWGLVVLFVLQGLGRGVWESTNKAIFLDYFAHDKVGAGAQIIIQNGGATAVAFFLSAYSPARPTAHDCVTRGECPAYDLEAWAIMVFSVVAVVGFLVASTLFARGISTWKTVGCGSHELDIQKEFLDSDEEAKDTLVCTE